MADGLELLGDVAADSLRVGVWGHELRMDLLDGLQLAEQAVELGIRDLRVIQGIVLVGIGAEQAVELRGADARALCRRGGSGASKERRLLGKVGCVLGLWSPILLRQGMAGMFCLASSLARRGWGGPRLVGAARLAQNHPSCECFGKLTRRGLLCKSWPGAGAVPGQKGYLTSTLFWPRSATWPMTAAGRPSSRRRDTSTSACEASTLTSRPPEVWGSNRTSARSSSTSGPI